MIRFFLTVSPRIRIYIKFKNIYTKCFEKKTQNEPNFWDFTDKEARDMYLENYSGYKEKTKK